MMSHDREPRDLVRRLAVNGQVYRRFTVHASMTFGAPDNGFVGIFPDDKARGERGENRKESGPEPIRHQLLLLPPDSSTFCNCNPMANFISFQRVNDIQP
jgi:hypothetical protein